MVEVLVGEQHRGRCQHVLGQQRVQLGDGILPRIDGHAAGACGRREHVAVGPERPGREPSDKHPTSLDPDPDAPDAHTRPSGPHSWSFRCGARHEIFGSGRRGAAHRRLRIAR